MLRRRSRPLHAAGDGALVAALRAGDERALEVMYDRYHLGLLGFCRHMLGSQSEAEDALQLVLLSAHDALRRDDRPVELKPWLYTVARNRCTSMLRARRDERPLDDERHASTTGLALADEVEQRDDLRAMLDDVAALPDEQRAALVLAELADLTHAEIGMTLGVPTNKVKALVFQARTSLIGSRQARDTSCEEIREQLATLRGSALRRTEITRHLGHCAGCTAFGEELRLQRAGLACVLPIAPALALKQQLLSGLAAAGTSGAVGGAAGVGGIVGAGATGGATTVAAAGSSISAAKVLSAVVLAGGIGGGAVATERAVREPAPVPAEQRAPAPSSAAPALNVRPAGPAAPAAATLSPGRSGAARGRAGKATAQAAARRRQAEARARREARKAARQARTGSAQPGAGGLGAAGGQARSDAVRAGTPGRSASAPGTRARAPKAVLAAPKAAPGRERASKSSPAVRATPKPGVGATKTPKAKPDRDGTSSTKTARPSERERARTAP